MKTKTIAMGIISAMIAVILITNVMVPALGTLTEEQSSSQTYTNDGAFFRLVGNDGTAHTINVALEDDTFKVTTDGAETRTMDMYVPQSTGIADAIAIGVYEAYNDNGVLTSKSGVSPTASQSIDTFRTQALAGNTDITNGTYQLWNFYQYTLMKMIGYTVMGNTDSQYMMGAGITSGSKTNTGTTSSAYQKSTSGTTAESLFIENGWGNVNEFVGDVNFNNYVINAGNTLGGNAIASVEGTNTTTASIPSSSGNFINTINMNPDVWGIPLTATSTSATTSGQGINDKEWSNTGQKLLFVGGSWSSGSYAGLSYFHANNDFSGASINIGSRLAYVIPDGGSPSADYGYVITFDTTSGQTIISDVQALDNGSLISKMPTGTTLNSFWDFDTTTGVGPFGAYYVAINLSSGANADDSAEARLSTQKGEIAYRLNPNNLHQTLAGTTFDPTLYNVMIVIPTAYWYSDPSTNKLYIGSSANTFDDITMVPYAHMYTIDPDVDTGNPVQEVSYASTSLVMGENSIVRLYANGDVKLITENDTITIGTVASGTDVSFTVTDDTLGYEASGTTSTQSGMIAYVSNEGEMVYAHNPTVTDDSQIVIGGITNGLETTGTETVTIGYCISGTYGTIVDQTITVLDPTASGTATYVSTEMTVNTTEVGTNAYRIDSILFTSSWSDDSTSTATYTYFLAPAEITVEGTTVSAGGILSTLVSVIPLIVLVGVILGIIGLFGFKK